MRVFRDVACMALVVLAGCSQRPRRVDPPRIEPATAGKAAIATYDTDGNGQIDGPELDQATSIKAALAKFDTNNDRKVSAEEISDRIRSWQAGRVGVMGVAYSVELDGKPVEGAVVTFVPENFLGDEIQPCTGTSDAHGVAMLSIDDPDLKSRRISGAHCGLYRVTIKGQGIPAKYGSADSPLGAELAPDSDLVQSALAFKLTSRAPGPSSRKP